MSLANYYRPKTFADVIGQEHITSILQATVQQSRTSTPDDTSRKMHNNYLFYGPRGTGKTSTARLFSKALNAQTVDDNMNPALDDPNVIAIDSNSTLDYVEIDAASHTGVDNIREEILSKTSYPPTTLTKKIYVIDEVHMLSKGAFNALLKTIEEPKPYMCFILATTEIHKIPDTIISRCQVFNFKKVPEDKIVGHLKNIAEKENIRYDAEALKTIARISEGCMRDAIKYVDQVSILGDITMEHVASFLGVASQEMIIQFLAHMKSHNLTQATSMVDEMQEIGIDLYNFAKQLLMYIDTHLHEDTQFFLQVTDMCTEVLRTVKFYPYPAIVYKIVIHKFLDNYQDTTSHVIHQPQHIPSPVQTQSQPIQETSPISSGSETISHSKQEDSIPSKDSQSTSIHDIDLDQLKEQVLAKIDKSTIKDNIMSNTIFDTREDDILTIVSINTIADIMLQKSENIQYLEDIISTVIGRNIRLHVLHEKKEDYFQRKLSS